MDKFTGNGLSYPLVRVRKIIFEIRGGATSGNARFVERHGDLLCPDDASNYLKAQKKRWDKMEKVVVSERHKMSSEEFLNIVMVHARSFFPDEYKSGRSTVLGWMIGGIILLPFGCSSETRRLEMSCTRRTRSRRLHKSD